MDHGGVAIGEEVPCRAVELGVEGRAFGLGPTAWPPTNRHPGRDVTDPYARCQPGLVGLDLAPGAHRQAGAALLAGARILDWLDDTFAVLPA